MHGSNPFADRWTLRMRAAARYHPTDHGVLGLRNFLGPVAGDDLYVGPTEAPGTDSQGLPTPRDPIVPVLGATLRRLDARLQRRHTTLWHDMLPPPDGGPVPLESWENPSIPSGYTYLLQLIAHDTVESAAVLAADPTPRAVLQNMRRQPLMLDTVYGNGPDSCPHVYELSAAHRDTLGTVPRTRLRVGPKRPPLPGTIASDCPFRDIGRAVATSEFQCQTHTYSDDGGLDTPFRKRFVTEALVADRRNDAHALMSQMTVLFHLLHNQIVDRLEQRPSLGDYAQAEQAYRQFLCARLAVTLIYRNIVEKDVLRLILHPAVYAHYTAPGHALLDPTPGVPLEFTHAAFRFGHAMVRDAYRVNTETALPLERGLQQTSTRSPGFLPVSDRWMVDWARFFCTGTIEPNLSRRIGPEYAAVLHKAGIVAPREPDDDKGLPARDLMAACFAGLWSLPRLYARLETRLGGTALRPLLPPFAAWRDALASWLAQGDPTGLTQPLSPHDVAELSDNPPLAFFVLFEAAHSIVDGRPVLRAGGRHLGPVGSIIVAETLFGALRLQPTGLETAGPRLADRVAACCANVLADANALADLPEIETMPQLLGFMAQGSAFAATS